MSVHRGLVLTSSLRQDTTRPAFLTAMLHDFTSGCSITKRSALDKRYGVL
jgi:hypothetical protein